MTTPSIVHSSVEAIGEIRLAPSAEPMAMEFVSEVLRVADCVVDAVTQAVHPGDARLRVELSWLHPRADEVQVPPVAASFVERGVLAPLGGAVNEFYLLMETCAGLFVCDQAGLLAGADLVGARAETSDECLDEALALYGCAVPAAGVGPAHVRVGELFVPRFWIRPAGTDTGHFDSPRWAAAGYSTRFLDDLRSRLVPVPQPRPSLDAYDPQWTNRAGAEGRRDDAVAACHEAGAVILPALAGLRLGDRAALYARMSTLVAVHGESNVNVAFLPDRARFSEVFIGDETPGQFAILAGLRGLAYSAHVSAPAHEDSGVQGVGVQGVGAQDLAAPPIYLLTGVWDNADLLDDWLEHHRGLGVAGVLAMDFGSTDGSAELLRTPKWSSFVRTVPFPGLRADHSLMQALDARERWPRGWALMIDPDEFLVTATGDLTDPVLRGAMAAADIVTIPRFEMTTRRSAAEHAAEGHPEAADLTLRLVEQDQGKVMFDLASDATPTLSAHEGHGRAHVPLTGHRTALLHAPVRSFARYAQKVDHAAITLAANDHLDAGHAWHWRRWIRIRDEGGLPAEYLEQFVPDADVPDLVADGTYVIDDRLQQVVRSARTRPS